jgi:hypothetical protein
MTVSSSTSKVQYNGDGSTAVFPYTFKVFDQDDLTVIIRSINGVEITKTVGTHYTVSGVGGAGGGNVTMLTAPASGEQLTILREQGLVQELDLVPNDPFPAQSLEDALDKLTFMVQTHSEELDRSIKASKTNSIGSTEFTVLAADRANKVFAFDSAGELSVAQELGTYRAGWSAATAYAERDIVKDTSNSNIYICLAAHTSSGVLPVGSNADVAKWGLIVDAASATASAAAAAASEAAADLSQVAAAASESAAAASEAASAGTASASQTSAIAAAASQVASASSASAASSSASAASTSASNAAASASNASTSATASSNAATSAETSASNAATSASNAAASEAAADLSQVAAAASEVAAAASASSASTSASSAASSSGTASASAAAALAALDSFDDRYLGAKASDPSLDNDGNALLVGAMYFSTSNNIMKVYDGAIWIAAYASLSGALLSINNLSDVNNASAAILNLGITATASELNALDGITATASELNSLVGVTGVASQADAQAGTSNALLMTPLRVSEAINSWSAKRAYVKSGVWSGAVNGDLVLFDTSSSSATLTLPASPLIGDVIYVAALSELNAGKTITVSPNGSLIDEDTYSIVYAANMPTLAFFYNGSSWISHTTSIAVSYARPFIPNWSIPDITMTTSGIPTISSAIPDYKGVWCYIVGGGGCGNNAQVYQAGWGFGGAGGRAHLHYTTVGRLRGASVTIGAGVTNSGSWRGVAGSETKINFPNLSSVTTGIGVAVPAFSVAAGVFFAPTSTDQTSTYINMTKYGVVSSPIATTTLAQPTFSETGPDDGGPNWIFCGSEGYGAYSSNAGGTTNGTSVYAGGGNASNGAFGTFPGGGGGGSTYVNTAIGHGANGVAKFYFQP